MTDEEKKPDVTPEAEPEKKDDKPETFDRAYVEELRKENAKHRTDLRKVQAQLEQLQTEHKTKEDEKLAKDQEWQQLAETRKTEIDTLKAQLKAKDVQMVRVKVAAEFGLNVPLDEDGSETLADRLRGDTEDELRKDAARLAKLFKTTAKAEGNPDPADKQPEQPAEKQPGTTPEARRQQTTAVPGGPPSGRTDEDRRREYFSAPSDSPIFKKGPIRVNTKSTQIE